jgi:hypothetical protein
VLAGATLVVGLWSLLSHRSEPDGRVLVILEDGNPDKSGPSCAPKHKWYHCALVVVRPEHRVTVRTLHLPVGRDQNEQKGRRFQVELECKVHKGMPSSQ